MTAVHHSEQQTIAAAIGRTRLLPVVVLQEAAGAEPLAAALAEGGLRSVEVTFRTAAAAAAIKAMSARADLLVGAGTVLSVEQVDRAAEAGARFVVSPGFSPRVVRHCVGLGLPVFPGAATATEVQMALDEGLDTVKFFPAEDLGGVRMIKALAAPFRAVRFIPTGGVNTGNLADYLALPSVLAVGGTWMVAPDLLAEGRWDEVTRRTAAAVAAAGGAA
ncbi:bifunctional 4-hydroxy-2-oxoglutarate aldolase/2-dehydro-3-deoxy-phosphogluconate aldolase [Rhizomonospora bruguierae]|uniref:bifunctional 4-hydroxy-2-oxoglutarate aldolase/2-dehydro-3-deoxy-phosphogluconate aldolase n=1 Tax=Rhizomonospora bruguierae TaxID=1581705 RepID=UPI001BCE80AD|nr:bifunctional 4-hydroxy-2-oxoglutarate aldolase/2-dehydro-3-deoxy-phosphogluconate aldolase [Micromonospora sp. NBRC 107566]